MGELFMGLSVNFYLKNSTMVIRLIGEMDQETVGNLRIKLTELIEEYKIKNIVFNLSKLEFMDSTGIGIIIGRYNQLRKKNGKIILCNLNKNIEKIIILSGLPRICLIKNNEEESYEYLEALYG
jgi:stage II sporulation protein AA (anti-sigma F factor antagonist)